MKYNLRCLPTQPRLGLRHTSFPTAQIGLRPHNSMPFSTTSHPRPGLACGLIPLLLSIPPLITITIKIRITTLAGVFPRVTLQCYKDHYRTTKPIFCVRFLTLFNFSNPFLSKHLRSKNKLCTEFNPLSGFFSNILSYCTY